LFDIALAHFSNGSRLGIPGKIGET